ncbi:putative methyltransferase YcgJ [Jeotgalicoccus aerolatus]|uniref:Ubiquinone/menaquinone biosynthesis C-methylase UbiE n=1 Tax=Jeotgalicoccus aerolatus TaxID=709510 RepID=A0ABS4HQH7_9STAP|nr:class I SAM-dependent methyltransferase [Jeotgalicoccus aerolatus]MBP1952859.1 ubiquinone/menaquinone biosynthesis C-methylase UbiE [Jeotgalicoccus aerolatus]GGE07464.1 methyltransferase [Jeotgalicoccus aerolatus]CAD2080458.1 putative methyltransferase YcgJ [Jeotgalicoccus aerolatus]
MKTNFHNYAEEYFKHRNDIPSAFFEELTKRNIELSGSKVADIGAGPGFVSKVLSEHGAIVDAVEPSEEFIKIGKKYVGDDDRISFTKGTAEHTGLNDDTYDIVIVMRAWHWFESDKASKEMRRILKPDGLLIVADVGFKVASKMMKDSMRIVKKNSKHEELRPAGSKEDSIQMINGFPVEWFSDWRHERLDLEEFFKHEYRIKFTDQEWLGRLGTSSWLVSFKKKQMDKTMEKISEQLDSKDNESKHKVPHVLNVAILKNKYK